MCPLQQNYSVLFVNLIENFTVSREGRRGKGASELWAQVFRVVFSLTLCGVKKRMNFYGNFQLLFRYFQSHRKYNY